MVENWQAKPIRAGRTVWNYKELMGHSVCGYFFGGYHDATGVIMSVAREEVHPIMQPPHHSSDFGNLFAKIGELFAEVHHLLLKALDASSEAIELTFHSPDRMRLPNQRDNYGHLQQPDEGQKAVEDV